MYYAILVWIFKFRWFFILLDLRTVTYYNFYFLYCYRYIRPHNGLEGDWTPFSETSCGNENFITGVAIRTDSENKGIVSQLKVVFKDDRGATDLKMMCEDGKEMTSSANMLGKHR